MIVSLGHGKVGVLGANAKSAAAMSEEFVALDNRMLHDTAFAMASHPFGYLFSGDGLPEDDKAFDKLRRLGEAMISDGGQMMGPSGNPAIHTYFGQFVDHDITLNTDADPDKLPDLAINRPDGKLVLNSRDEVTRALKNGRHPALNLDSVYGDGSDREAKLRDGARMRIGETLGGKPNDLPRFFQIEGEEDTVRQNTAIHPSTAYIGDGRNDENLIVAQLHLAFLRFHNAVVDWLDENEPDLDEEAKFARARDLTTLHYQWLVANVYLPAICDADALQAVRNVDARLYCDFARDNPGLMPLEFSVAAFRFGHSMIRHEYRFNANFPNASVMTLLRFTGGDPTDLVDNRLPDEWIIDWRNFLDSANTNLAARPTDSRLAQGLDNLLRRAPELRNLPVSNLRRSYVLNIPTAQSVLTELADIEPLTDDDLVSFAGGIIRELGYLEDTPLWLYLLVEAETRGGGTNLGPLGTTIVASTLLGLLVQDSASFWHRRTGKAASWHPADAQMTDKPIDSFERFLRFAGVLEGDDE